MTSVGAPRLNATVDVDVVGLGANTHDSGRLTSAKSMVPLPNAVMLMSSR